MVLLALVCFVRREATPLALSVHPTTSAAVKGQRPTAETTTRRAFLSRSVGYVAVAAIITGLPAAAPADEGASAAADGSEDYDRGGRPFAPTQALLPATRLKLWVEDVHALTQEAKGIEDATARLEAVRRADEKLSSPPELFRGEKMEKRTAFSSTAQLTTGISSANKDQYQLNRRGLTNIGDKVTAALNQADVERQWGMLQYAESKREEGSEMRSAFNFYSRQLTFGERYVLTASPEDRKRMIRNDELPTLTAVIASDLDRRDLYRNDFLTAIEDAKAEAAYQARQSAGDVDVAELVDLVSRARSACDDWFSLIAPRDVEDAVKAVESERIL